MIVILNPTTEYVLLETGLSDLDPNWSSQGVDKGYNYTER